MCILHFARLFFVVSENLPTRILRAGTTHSNGECTPGCHIWHTYCEALTLTHLCQPLDGTCFHSLKTYWDNACDQYMFSNPGSVVTIYQFSQLLSIALSQAMTPRTIMPGFKGTGIFPLNRYAIRYLVNAQGFQIHLQLFSPRKTSVFCHSTHPHMLLGNCSQVRNKSAFNVVMKKAMTWLMTKGTTCGLRPITQKVFKYSCFTDSPAGFPPSTTYNSSLTFTFKPAFVFSSHLSWVFTLTIFITSPSFHPCSVAFSAISCEVQVVWVFASSCSSLNEVNQQEVSWGMW